MYFRKISIGTLVLSIFFIGCESQEKKDIFAAQVCIDGVQIPDNLREGTSTEVNGKVETLRAEVSACTEAIQNYTSKEAFTLKCAAGFLSGGIGGQAIIEIVSLFDDKNSQGGTIDPTPQALEVISFGSSSADKTLANETSENCINSETDGLIALSGLANFATQFESIAGDGLIDNLINTFDPESDDISEEEKIDLANTILDSHVELCDSNSGIFKEEEVCGDLNEAIEATGGGDELSNAEKEILINGFLEQLQN